VVGGVDRIEDNGEWGQFELRGELDQREHFVRDAVIARIEAIGWHTPSGLVFVDVSYWAADIAGDPLFRNDFLIDVRTHAERPVADEYGQRVTVSGRALTPMVEVDGEWRVRPEDPGDPWQRVTIQLDPAAQVTDAVRAYGIRSTGSAGDHRGVALADIDAAAILPELAALAGATVPIS
jgi:hypothetical protein